MRTESSSGQQSPFSVRHLEAALANGVNLVAQFGGLLELQVLGGLEHGFFQARDLTRGFIRVHDLHLVSGRCILGHPTRRRTAGQDRKSTRLNSSHVAISYAVFCLKKKKSMTKK